MSPVVTAQSRSSAKRMKRLDYKSMAQRIRHLVPILVAAIVGSVLSIAAWLVITDWEKRLAEQELSDVAADQTLALQNGIKEYLGKMFAVRALFNASEHGQPRGIRDLR